MLLHIFRAESGALAKRRGRRPGKRKSPAHAGVEDLNGRCRASLRDGEGSRRRYSCATKASAVANRPWRYAFAPSDSFTAGKRRKVFRGYYFVALFWKLEISTNDFVGRLRGFSRHFFASVIGAVRSTPLASTSS
jgi:hypothetical protein